MCKDMISNLFGGDKKESTSAALIPAQTVSNTGTVKTADVKQTTSETDTASQAGDNIGTVVNTSENLGDLNLGAQKKRKKVVGLDL